MKKLTWIAASLLLLLTVISFMPVNTSRDNSVAVSGLVSKISEGGYRDVQIRLEGEDDFYYINRGLEGRFALEQLKTLEGKAVTLMYAKHWSLFGLFFNPGWHVTELREGNNILYSEFN